MNRIFVPPIKCQGIKTKIVPLILANTGHWADGIWYEPFMGSGVVGFNRRPARAVFSDINPHIIAFYGAIKTSQITPAIARAFLKSEGAKLLIQGEKYYYEVRDRFNHGFNPFDFLFLSRACFNGMIRFNSKGKFNVPFCRKPQRFSASYITKIVNQIKYVSESARHYDWRFECASFDRILSKASEQDIIYCDPPYLGRHVDYFNSWTEHDERRLYESLSQTKAKFILSTWHSNKYRKNPLLHTLWSRFYAVTKKHFYHVGARESNRNAIIEALVMNFPPVCSEVKKSAVKQAILF